MHDSEAYRPRFHFAPHRNWMNDPNGLLFCDGEYHLFYQHNPYGREWGHMSWGHAVSQDLVHWTHLPIALMEEPENSITIFSGSAVLDRKDTSGFGRGDQPAVVAVYTADHRPRELQNIHIAYSTDRGRTFTKYAGNPVVDVGEAKFGDPKVFWHEDSGRWIMVNICGRPQGKVLLYGSSDLKTWEYLSEFEAPVEAPGIWECPDLFPLPLDGDSQKARWVLKVNCVGRVGHASRYFVGDFDGHAFLDAQLVNLATRPDDDNFYAEVTYNGIPRSDGRRLLLGWVRQVPRKARPWTGMQSIPRVLTLRPHAEGFRLCQTPIDELQNLRGEHYAAQDEIISGGSALLAGRDFSGELEIDAEFEPRLATEFGFKVRLGADAGAVVGYSIASEELFVSCSGRERLALPLPLENGCVKLHIFLDRSIVEVFGGDGEVTITTLLEPNPACQGLGLFARNGPARLVKMDIWRMAPAGKSV